MERFRDSAVVFDRLSRAVERAIGHPAAFCAALAAVLLWGVSGPLFAFSEAWRLVINTGTTIVTFLIVFLIQATQSRDTAAMHLKLDELVRAIGSARNEVISAEEASHEELERMRAELQDEA